MDMWMRKSQKGDARENKYVQFYDEEVCGSI